MCSTEVNSNAQAFLATVLVSVPALSCAFFKEMITMWGTS